MTTLCSQDMRDETLTTLFASGARATILRFFLLDPTRAYYQRQVETATGLPIRAVQRELERLTGLGLLYRRAEGNRAYYQVDADFPLYAELRNMVVKTVSLQEQVRAAVAADESVRLAFLSEAENRLLVVLSNGNRPAFEVPAPYVVEMMSSEDFAQALSDDGEALGAFLDRGLDLLGRRDDVMWRRIEASGHNVTKGRGVA